jgi:mannose-6-phosphate isomerase-like protein (cupin superfamily)
LQTADQTNGKLLQIMYAVEKPETKPTIPLHFHSQCSERFEVVSGRLGVILNDEQHQLGIGEEINIPPGTSHTFWNAGEEALRFITDVRPPGQLQTYWETVFGLAEDGKVGRNGLPNLLQLAVVAPLADSYPPNVPLPVSRLLVSLFAGIGRMAGYKASYAEYS